MKKEFPILYKYTQTGATQQWQIIVEEDRFYTIEGQKDGKLTTSLPTICYGKNIGKKNQTSPMEQAMAEATSKWQKKKDKSYNEVLTDEKNFFEPMLAHNINDYKHLLFTVRTFIQPKMDGLCCISENNKEMSRNGKEYVACPHLHQNEVILHGELYNSEYHDDFNKIVSLCKKSKPTIEEIKESKDKVQLWIYDFPSSKEKVFSDRYKDLTNWFNKTKNKSYVLVPTYEVFSEQDIQKYTDKFLEDGYEGSIIRLDLGPYENKRSKQVLKKKEFVDEEYIIKDVVEGEGGRSGTVGKFIMELGDGRSFGSNVKGTFEYLKQLLSEKDDLIGKKATVKSFAKTPAGIPRFGYVIKIDRDSYE